MSCGVVQRLGVANVDENTARAGVRALFREVAITSGRSGGEGAGATADLGMVHYLSACATTGRPPCRQGSAERRIRRVKPAGVSLGWAWTR